MMPRRPEDEEDQTTPIQDGDGAACFGGVWCGHHCKAISWNGNPCVRRVHPEPVHVWGTPPCIPRVIFRLWTKKGGELLGTYDTAEKMGAAMKVHSGGQGRAFYLEVERQCAACGRRFAEDPIVGPDVAPLICLACARRGGVTK